MSESDTRAMMICPQMTGLTANDSGLFRATVASTKFDGLQSDFVVDVSSGECVLSLCLHITSHNDKGLPIN